MEYGQMVKVKDLKKGDMFTKKLYDEPTDRQIFIRDDYDFTDKKYIAIRYSDICDSITLKGDTMVFVL